MTMRTSDNLALASIVAATLLSVISIIVAVLTCIRTPHRPRSFDLEAGPVIFKFNTQRRPRRPGAPRTPGKSRTSLDRAWRGADTDAVTLAEGVDEG